MDNRQKQLLNLVIENHIETAEPIGSKFLVSDARLDWSEATVRNELRALEEEGYLSHPHTSAGRVPTEKGYRYFVDNIDLEKVKLSKKDQIVLEGADLIKDREVGLKNLAKRLAEVSGDAVILAFSPNKVYYTGLSNLFNKPEFVEMKLVADISAMFDSCEDCLNNFFDKVEKTPQFFIGKEHTFGPMMSMVSFRFGENSLLSLLGLQRMDYRHNWILLKTVENLLVSAKGGSAFGGKDII